MVLIPRDWDLEVGGGLQGAWEAPCGEDSLPSVGHTGHLSFSVELLLRNTNRHCALSP